MIKKIILVVILISISLVFIYLLISGSKQLIGGCAGVHPEHVQECCDRWAEENEIVRIQCVGYWKIRDNQCSWICGTPNDSEEACLVNGGRWVEKQIGGFLDLKVNSDEECRDWGGNCGEKILSSFNIGKCDDGSDCWLPDIWSPKCLIKK